MDSNPPLPPPSLPPPTAWSPVPPSPLPEVALQPEPAPRKRRTGLIVGGVVVAALVAGGVTFALTRGDDKESSSGGGAYSLTAAATSAQDAQFIAYEMNISVMGQSVQMEARMDVGASMMAMSMEMPGGAGSLDAIVDGGNQVMYMNTASFGSMAPTPWISMDLSKVPGGAQAFGASTENPLDVSKLFTDADNVEEVGLEDFRGEQVKHYRVTLDTAEAMSADPNLRSQLDELGGDFPEQLVYDVYITEDNELRRMTFEIDVMGQTMAAEMVLTALDSIEPIVIPPADQVTDLTEQLGGQLGG